MYAHVYVSTDKSLERYTHFRSAEERRVRTSNKDGRERGVQLREGTVTLQTFWGIHFLHLRLRRLANDVRAGTAFGLLARASPHTCGFLGSTTSLRLNQRPLCVLPCRLDSTLLFSHWTPPGEGRRTGEAQGQFAYPAVHSRTRARAPEG